MVQFWNLDFWRFNIYIGRSYIDYKEGEQLNEEIVNGGWISACHYIKKIGGKYDKKRSREYCSR